MQQKLQVKVEEMMDEFSKQWQPVMENLEVAEQAFDDVEGPRTGPRSWPKAPMHASHSCHQQSTVHRYPIVPSGSFVPSRCSLERLRATWLPYPGMNM